MAAVCSYCGLIIVLSVVSVWIAMHFIYPYLLGRHRLIGPWTRVSVIGHLLYVAANLLALCFRPSTIANVGHWAGRLSLINMAVLFAGSPLVYFADIIGISLRASRRIHWAAACISGMLLACHVTIMVITGWGDFDLQKIDNIFAIIGAGVIGAILFFSLPFLRCRAYEVFPRGHQGLAGLLLYATWRHLSSHHSTSRLFLLIIFGVFLLMFVLQTLHLLYRNGIFSSRGRPRALITRLSNEGKEGQDDEKQNYDEKNPNQAKKENATRPLSVLVNLSRPMKLDAGQYIYLCLPSLTF